MSLFKKHKHGILATLFFHVAAIILLLILGFTTPLPLPEEEGILLDFGGAGSGTIDPGPSSPGTSNAQHDASSHNTPLNGNLTQDSEEAPALPSSDNATSNQITEPQLTEEEIRQQQQANHISGMMNFGNNGSNSDADGTGSGHPGYGGDGSSPGDGGGPGGIGGGIGNRDLKRYVKPEKKDNLFGEVKLKITVDENGNVREIFVESSTCTECIQYAKAAVRQWKYEKKSGVGLQTGIVVITFEQQ